MPAQKIFLTGIDSFTGKHLGAYLTGQGYAVCGASRRVSDPDNGIYQCDITAKDEVEKAVARAQPDHVIHLAGISHARHENAEDYYRVNTLGTEWLLSAIARHAPAVKKVIVASTAAVYGGHAGEFLDESLCPQPDSHYGISKLAAEHVARRFSDRLPVIIARPFNYVGPGQPLHFVIPKIVGHFRRGDGVIELGNVDVVREFNDVRVACQAYAGLLRAGKSGETVNLCTGRGVTLSRVVRTLEEISGRAVEIRINPEFVRRNEQPRLVGSPEKLNGMIGALPDIPLEQTLQSMIGE